MHHGCGTTLWKRAGDRPPNLNSARPRSAFVEMSSRHAQIDQNGCSKVPSRTVRGSQKCPWQTKLETVSVAHRALLLRGRTEGIEHPANAATLFHAVTNPRPPVRRLSGDILQYTTQTTLSFSRFSDYLFHIDISDYPDSYLVGDCLVLPRILRD